MQPFDDPAIASAPFGGPDVDGTRLLHEAVGFGRALRVAGLAIDLGAAVDYARALSLVEIGDREQVRAAGEAIFVRRRDDRAIYDAVFARWWRQRGRRQGDFQAPPLQRPNEQALDPRGCGRPGGADGRRPACRSGATTSAGSRSRPPARTTPTTTRTSMAWSSPRTPTRAARCSATANSTG